MKQFFSVVLTGLMLLSSYALADDIPVIPPGTLCASQISFAHGYTYPVYSAPDCNSLRGHNGKAVVSTNDWIQVFGSVGDWLLVQYDIHAGQRLRIGYIPKEALEGKSIPALALTSSSAVCTKAVEATDDPLQSRTCLAALDAGAEVTMLGTLGEWAYIEGKSNGTTFRGFVPADSLSLTRYVTALDEAIRALPGTWSLYAGSCIGADRLEIHADGAVVGRYEAGSGWTEWTGTWSLRQNELFPSGASEFELAITNADGAHIYGLRLCNQAGNASGSQYALILSGETGTGNFREGRK